MCRILLGVALMTEMRPSELHLLRISQLNFTIFNGEKECVVKGRLGSLDGSSKCAKDDFKSVKLKKSHIKRGSVRRVR